MSTHYTETDLLRSKGQDALWQRGLQPSEEREVNEEVKRWMNGREIREATAPLELVPNRKDFLAASVAGGEKDPMHCVLACTAARAFSGRKAVFLRTVAYVEKPDAEGNNQIFRYAIPKETRKIIERFDKNIDSFRNTGLASSIERSITLIPPPASMELEKQRKAKREWRNGNKKARARERGEAKRTRRRNKALTKGELVDPADEKRAEVGNGATPLLYSEDISIRNGQGMIQMHKTHEKSTE